jgi:hypothetical protein
MHSFVFTMSFGEEKPFYHSSYYSPWFSVRETLFTFYHTTWDFFSNIWNPSEVPKWLKCNTQDSCENLDNFYRNLI